MSRLTLIAFLVSVTKWQKALKEDGMISVHSSSEDTVHHGRERKVAGIVWKQSLILTVNVIGVSRLA